MIKILIVQFILLAFCLESIGQINDKIKLSCNYQLVYSENSKDILDVKSAVMTLDIGTHYSKFYSKDFYRKDSMRSIDCKVLSFAQLMAKKHEYKSKDPSYIIVKKYPCPDSLYYIKKILRKNYKYYEKPVFNWKLSSETDTLLTYHCQKAICKFAGREYVAWFTPEIPIADGPWKFSGTPGLILSIADTDGHYLFKCIEINTYGKRKAVISIPDKDYIACDKKAFNEVDFQCNQDPIAFFKSMVPGAKVHIDRLKRGPFSYNPIELE
jgi:GLPGLI family protein